MYVCFQSEFRGDNASMPIASYFDNAPTAGFDMSDRPTVMYSVQLKIEITSSRAVYVLRVFSYFLVKNKISWGVK